MKLKKLMKLALTNDVQGTVEGTSIGFKTERGFLFTKSSITEEWGRPKITSFWFQQRFTLS